MIYYARLGFLPFSVIIRLLIDLGIVALKGFLQTCFFA